MFIVKKIYGCLSLKDFFYNPRLSILNQVFLHTWSIKWRIIQFLNFGGTRYICWDHINGVFATSLVMNTELIVMEMIFWWKLLIVVLNLKIKKRCILVLHPGLFQEIMWSIPIALLRCLQMPNYFLFATWSSLISRVPSSSFLVRSTFNLWNELNDKLKITALMSLREFMFEILSGNLCAVPESSPSTSLLNWYVQNWNLVENVYYSPQVCLLVYFWKLTPINLRVVLFSNFVTAWTIE